MPKSSTTKPANWISDPAYGMALVLSIQYHHPHLTIRQIAIRAGLTWRCVNRIRLGKMTAKYMQQLALESLLLPETVAKLRAKYYIVPVPTFWDKYLTEGDNHARRE